MTSSTLEAGEIFFKTSSSLAFVRDARNSFAGEWAAMATARASPRLFGPTPVITTNAMLCFSGCFFLFHSARRY